MYALVDCNNFYASCERVFDPALRRRPVAILSNNDGCIVARSAELKALGLPMGVALHEWADFIRKHHVAVLSSNYVLYGDMSRRVMETLEQFSADMEIYSIDEAFLRLPAIPPEHLAARAREIRDTVRQWTGIPVSVGIAPPKTLAKLANHLSKKHAQYRGALVIPDPYAADDLLNDCAIGKVWGIGPRYAEKLRRRGITKALALRDVRDDWARKQLTVMGLRTVMELRGTPCIGLEDQQSDKKAIGCSRSFGKMISELKPLKEAVANYVTRAAEKLRAQHCVCGIVHVYLRTNRFREDLPQYGNGATMRLNTPTAYTPALITQALANLERIYKPGYRYKKAGVLLTEIVPENQVQMHLFEPAYPWEKEQRVMRAFDQVNRRYGSGTLGVLGEGAQKAIWRMRRNHLSPRYTTRWDELPRARL